MVAMDILLVNASVKKLSAHARLNPPLGLGYIAAVLRKNKYRVSAIDFNLSGFNPLLLEGIIQRERPPVLGISAHTETYCNGLAIAELAKRIQPDIKVVIGGTHPSVMYQEVARESAIDVVAIGEGDYTMLELADYYLRNIGELDQIRGIASKRDGQVKVTEERPFISDPDELPFPARDLFPMPLYKTPAQVLMSRGGCPFNCHFCAVNNIWKGSRRFRRPENVIGEIDYISRNFELDEISFADDAFTLNRSLVLKLCDLSKELPFNWCWKCATRVDLVDEELLRRMREAGCYSITYGVEAGSQEVLDAIGKKITLEQVRQAVRMALDVGIGVVCAFMFSHPFDTEQTVRQQKQFMKELQTMGVTLTMACTTPFPGTYYYENREKLGLKILASSWDEYDCKHVIAATRHLSEVKLRALLAEMVQDLGMVVEEEGGLC